MANKDEVRLEYITTKQSLRALAKKHGLNKDRVCRWAKDEDWETLRRQHCDKTQTAVLERDIQNKTDRVDALYAASDMLLKKVVAGIENAPLLTPTAASNYSNALKNIKEIQMIRTAEDLEEQRARIEKLRKDTEREEKSASITVTLEGGLAEYGR
jgi:hypothetical protein